MNDETRELLEGIIREFPLEVWVAKAPWGGIVLKFKGVVKSKDTGESVTILGMIGNDFQKGKLVFTNSYFNGDKSTSSSAIIMVLNQRGAIVSSQGTYVTDTKFNQLENFMNYMTHGLDKIISNPLADIK